MPGRSIRIFLPDGTPSGLRTAELGMSTIKAVVAPRGLLDKLALRPEAKRTGVYLLVGEDPNLPGRQMVYVGEGDETINRVLDHSGDASKEFFDSIYIFCSKDENLTKAHGRWLEARLVAQMRAVNRCTVANKTDPVGGYLPESDIAEMTDYADQLQLLLSALGLNVLEPVPATKVSPTSPALPEHSVRLHFQGDGYDATCELHEGAFVVLQGSRARVIEAPTLPALSKNARAELLKTGVIRATTDHLIFESDYSFSTASRAAQVICGFSINGWTAWKLPDGTTASRWQEQQLTHGQTSGS